MRRVLCFCLGLWFTGCQDTRGEPAEPARVEPAVASSATTQELVRVRSSSKLGVPLHPALKTSSVSGRIANESRVQVLGYSADRSWLEVQEKDGARGWISARYLSAASAEVDPPSIRPDSVWTSPASCRRIVASGKRMELPKGRVRIGSWNIRWFPDGGPGTDKQPTDVAWLACGITWLGVDLLAVQEFKRGGSDPAVKRLLTQLGRDTGGNWQLLLDDCPGDNRQHVGVLYNADRFTLTRPASEPEVNPKGNKAAQRSASGQSCVGRLRPGLGASVKHQSGLDFEILVLHLKSGTEQDDYLLRRRSLSGLDALLKRRTRAAAEQDVVVLGDWNSMGCARCASRTNAAQEQATLASELNGSGLTLLSAACTEYYQGKPGALDHAAISRSMSEAAGAELQVAGFCAESKCTKLREPPAAQQRLSDHCPVLLDLQALDLD